MNQWIYESMDIMQLAVDFLSEVSASFSALLLITCSRSNVAVSLFTTADLDCVGSPEEPWKQFCLNPETVLKQP